MGCMPYMRVDSGGMADSMYERMLPYDSGMAALKPGASSNSGAFPFIDRMEGLIRMSRYVVQHLPAPVAPPSAASLRGLVLSACLG